MGSEEDWAAPEGRGLETVGARVRSLRVSAGLSQAELADGRFSKEYLSQIERGKTRPTAETLEWLAGRLATDREYLEHGVGKAEKERFEAALRDAERLVGEHRYDDALRAFRGLREMVDGAPAAPSLHSRLLRGEAWARIRSGQLDAAMALLEEAAALTVTTGFTDTDRAEVVFQVGVVRYSQSSIAEAIVLFDQALILAEASGSAADRLRSDIFHWRSRCYRRNRDWVAAQEDIERALELAEVCADSRRIADALFQASLVAQRQGRWVLARTYAERARTLFEALGDRATVARLLNNLAGLNDLLGNTVQAIALLDEAFEIFVELDLAVDAGYVCSSLAEIRLGSDELELAERQARKALDLLGDREDHLQEVGTAQLALGRALAAQGRLDEAERWITSADVTFQQASSVSHRSSAWLAQGDIESQRGNDGVAAGFYRRAARVLQETDA
ncbi:MAG TPA: helix-turn-helix transcriptional regulator [Gaiellaceae bacterium]|nr:helix-turn-helix transcriptional regulator [Gaiellaceae bacterium]